MRSLISATRALSDESRLRALMALMGRGLCVCRIIELLGLAHFTVSRHMSILRRARLVSGRQKGRWMYYRAATDSGLEEIRQAPAWVRASPAGTDRIAKDTLRLEENLKVPPRKALRARAQCQKRLTFRQACRFTPFPRLPYRRRGRVHDRYIFSPDGAADRCDRTHAPPESGTEDIPTTPFPLFAGILISRRVFHVVFIAVSATIVQAFRLLAGLDCRPQQDQTRTNGSALFGTKPAITAPCL